MVLVVSVAFAVDFIHAKVSAAVAFLSILLGALEVVAAAAVDVATSNLLG